jgi:hypothetical protein
VSYALAEAALRATLKTTPGVRTVVQGEPSSVQAWPLVYTVFDGMTRTQQGQLTINSYRVMARLCVPIQENVQAEAVLAPFVNSIPATIDANATLGGAVNIASVTEAVSGEGGGYHTVASSPYRTITYTVVLVEKSAYKGGI